jgi:hypothetical protein
MMGVDGSWQILQKTRELLSSSRRLLQQMNGHNESPQQGADRKATDVDSFPTKTDPRSQDRK